jgi:magnesium chelatase subunit D
MDAVGDGLRGADAIVAALLVAIDPVGLPGACLRGAHGAAREDWLAVLRSSLPDGAPWRRLPLHIGDDRLLGGLDLPATLAAGRPVAQRGLLAETDGGVLLLPLAERMPPALVAHLASAMDAGEVVSERQGLSQRSPARWAVVALDEGVDDDARPPAALLDRLPFWIDLTGLRRLEGADLPDARELAAARSRLASVAIDGARCELLCAIALKFGIGALRASVHAVRAACALAALDGRLAVDDDDLGRAARLVLGPRAVVLPPDEEQPPEAPPEPPPESPDAGEEEQSKTEQPLEDRVLEAVIAQLPPGLLERLRSGAELRARQAADGRAGALRQSLLRGRPAGTRRGEPRAGSRLALVDTLRAAAPWQRVRRAARPAGSVRRVEIRRDDFHVARHKQRRRTTTVFVVDASGSAALNRLAEAKGAVELLLAECYVRRDEVAVIAFRGTTAQLVLPPTRSLVRAKRGLAALPGGAGTPLAAGLDAATALAAQVRRSGHTPTVVLLTDGQANVARDGTGGRERAMDDALASARALRKLGIGVLFIDIAPRPQPQARKIAAELGARYLALPHADARKVSAAVRAAGAELRRDGAG